MVDLGRERGIQSTGRGKEGEKSMKAGERCNRGHIEDNRGEKNQRHKQWL